MGGGIRELILSRAGHGTAMLTKDPDGGVCWSGSDVRCYDIKMLVVPEPVRMSRDSIIFGISGVFFGILVGIEGAWEPQPAAVPDAAQAATSTPGPGRGPGEATRRSRAAALQAATSNPRDVQTRLDLGSLYFDAQRLR